MIEIAEESRKRVEYAFLVGIRHEEDSEDIVREHLEELSELVGNLGIKTAGSIIVPIKSPSSQYYIGSGKADEIIHLAQSMECDCLVFDENLSPSQQRNWERLSKFAVVDREEIILDIFADRAVTKEAVLQVELARLKYSLPRLTRAWTHLSRQSGSGTNRGAGETQIETDRRQVKRRITVLMRELELIRKQRGTQRKSRERSKIPHGAIVGYTNVGKSSLLNSLSGAGVLTEDKLFATLDPTTRKLRLPNHQELLLTDTVGFVRKLPHSLVEAFKSTLEEAVLADFLILVLDISSPHLADQWQTTLDVLHELGAEDKDIIVVFNKIDKVASEDQLYASARTRLLTDGGIFVSTKTGENLNKLAELIQKQIAEYFPAYRIELPPDRHDLAALAHQSCSILSEHYTESGILEMSLNIPPELRHSFQLFIVNGEQK